MLELWNRIKSACFIKEVIFIIVVYHFIFTEAVVCESCGACQKKFVWTTAWPMEENYVTYKLIGPLADQSQISLVTPPGSSFNLRNRPSQPHQPNFFLHLSTPKDAEEAEKINSSHTESSENHFERVGIKTEAELDELSNRMEMFNNEEHQHIASLVNNGNFEKVSSRNVHNNNDTSSRKSVFSACKSDTVGQNKNKKVKLNTFELVSKPEKGSYISSKANAKSHQLPNSSSSRVIAKVENHSLRMPQLINLAKTQRVLSESTDLLHKALKIPYDPSVDVNKPFQWCMPVQHRPVAKKVSPNIRKPKVLEALQLKCSKMPTIENDPFFSDTTSLQARNKASYDSFNYTPSNILKIEREPPYKSDSSNLPDAESSISGMFPKTAGRAPIFRNENSSLVKMPANSGMKGNHIINSFDDSSKIADAKELNSLVKCTGNDKPQELNGAKCILKSRSLHKVPINDKKDKQPHVGEKFSAKKRRAYPNPKDIKDKTSQRMARVQPRIKLPLRFRPRIVNNLSGIKSDNNTNFLTSWFKELSPT